MKKKLFLTAILTLLCCTLLIAGASATLQGTGTAEDPYKISSADDLKAFAEIVNSGKTDACAELTEDIDLDCNDTNPWTPIGGYIFAYTGTFNGNGHTIDGLYCSDSDGCVGLFGYVGDGGTVKNFTVIGTVSGATAGGVCGYNKGGTIIDSTNSGTVNGGDDTGSVCGYNDGGTITGCFIDRTVTVSGETAGGVCGWNTGTITNCYWLDVEGSRGIGDDDGTATDVEAKTDTEFASGEVAYLLNTWDGDGTVDGKVWAVGDDGYPVLRPDKVNTVVKVTIVGTDASERIYATNSGETLKTLPTLGNNELITTENAETVDLNTQTFKADTKLYVRIAVTVTADSFDLFVGDAEPTLTCTISPAVEMEGIELKCDANMYTPGVYPITVTGPASDDLHVYTYVPGKLTVRNSWIVTVDGEVNYVKPGDTFKMPPAPSKPGYIFMGWSDGKTTWQPNDTVDITSDLTIKSVWANMPDITPTEPDEGLPFTDVPEGAWYYEAVKQVYEAGLMNGVTDTLFDPDGTLTRAMFWTILARASGMDTDGGATWYAVAQQWAVENGVSDGTDAMGALTREQLVTMLWRLNGEPVVNYLITTPDANQISPWALEAMKWAASTGLIEGDENGNLTPTATCTRAQAATFLVRYLTTE